MGVKGSSEGGEFKIYLIHCKNFCKCLNVPSTTIKEKVKLKIKINIKFLKDRVGTPLPQILHHGIQI
jgi:hypothetical protein